jgi:hypothetical protein
LTHGARTSTQYHPNPAWLRDHGFTTNLAKCVRIPDNFALLQKIWGPLP